MDACIHAAKEKSYVQTVHEKSVSIRFCIIYERYWFKAFLKEFIIEICVRRKNILLYQEKYRNCQLNCRYMYICTRSGDIYVNFRPVCMKKTLNRYLLYLVVVYNFVLPNTNSILDEKPIGNFFSSPMVLHWGQINRYSMEKHISH